MDLESRLRRYGPDFHAGIADASARRSTPAPPGTRGRRRFVLAAAVVVAVALGVAVLVVGRDPVRTRAGAPSPGTAVPADCIDQGPATVVVPDVVGRRLGAAIRAVERSGLNVVGFGTVDTDPVGSRARVRAQEPPAGTEVPRGACIGFRTVNGASSTLEIVALPDLEFDRRVYTVPSGQVTIRLVARGGPTASLEFDDPRLDRCRLTTARGGPDTCQVVLTPGRYGIGDVVPGRRAAGLAATIVVRGG
jgi:hypothetical protein